MQLVSGGGLQVQAIENLAEFGSQKLGQHASFGSLDFSRPNALFFRQAIEPVQQNVSTLS